eukprot:TRINITY_DN3796_c1_g1_i2.p1 TRINITY_DN3796_c1_g1~~TRINITY_DN3796_c1_g1_i2.p1  ORF type:complete len:115 (+),score=33.88 TRINITY_DN3796_c1_g1_i2:155-499(+)
MDLVSTLISELEDFGATLSRSSTTTIESQSSLERLLQAASQVDKHLDSLINSSLPPSPSSSSSSAAIPSVQLLRIHEDIVDLRAQLRQQDTAVQKALPMLKQWEDVIQEARAMR